MRDRNDRLRRDAMRKADLMRVTWDNGPVSTSMQTMDREFMVDVSNAYARYCDRMEQLNDGHKFSENLRDR